MTLPYLPPLPSPFVASPLAGTNCTRPPGWCNESTSFYKALDCNGDGLTDQACGSIWGERWVILSTNDCLNDSNGQAPDTACPAFFDSESAGGGGKTTCAL